MKILALSRQLTRWSRRHVFMCAPYQYLSDLARTRVREAALDEDSRGERSPQALLR